MGCETHQVLHAGYDTKFEDDDLHKVLLLDVLRELERRGEIGELYESYLTQSGQGTLCGKRQADRCAAGI